MADPNTTAFECWAIKYYSCDARLIPQQARDAWNAGMAHSAAMLGVQAAKAIVHDPSDKTGHVLSVNAKAIREAAGEKERIAKFRQYMTTINCIASSRDLHPLLKADMGNGCRFSIEEVLPMDFKIISYGYEVSPHVKDEIERLRCAGTRVIYEVKNG